MMNYDGLLSQLTDDKMKLFEMPTSTRFGQNLPEVQEGAVEEEQAAAVCSVPQGAFVIASTVQSASKVLNTPKTEASAINNATPTATTTPQRKISTSSRFMNAFSQFYTNATTSNVGPGNETQNEEAEIASRTPTKGMESKLLSMWHNVKYGWSGKMRTSSFSKEQPVWLLGRCYHRRYTPPVSMESSIEHNLNANINANDAPETDKATSAFDTIEPIVSSLYPALNPNVDEIVIPQELGMDAVENQVAENPWEEGIEGFKRDFFSRIWMTYRREFPIMNGSNYTSDCGWGCMLRSGQMLLAQGLICHFLGRCWRYDAETQLHTTYEDNTHKKIIKWFGDSSSKSSPFSIHALVRLGEELGKKPGDWYGPASVSYLLKHALENASQENADFDNITIYVAKDCTIYIQDVEDLCLIPEPAPKPHVPWQTVRKVESTPKLDKQHWKALIVLIPLRLGTEKLNPVYANSLKLLLSTEYCIGIIGGRPKHSLYFVGFQEDKLIHLDPHYCQEMVDVNQENYPLHSFHCKSPRKIKCSKMDPSCCIGFYCANKADFDSFVESVQMFLHPMRSASGTAVDKMFASGNQQTNSANNSSLSTNDIEINYPLFTFSRGRCLDFAKDEMSDSLYKPLQRQVAQYSQELGIMNSTTMTCDFDDDGETEEFVLL